MCVYVVFDVKKYHVSFLSFSGKSFLVSGDLKKSSAKTKLLLSCDFTYFETCFYR